MLSLAGVKSPFGSMSHLSELFSLNLIPLLPPVIYKRLSWPCIFGALVSPVQLPFTNLISLPPEMVAAPAPPEKVISALAVSAASALTKLARNIDD